jgi:two-component system sensor histidine kinase AlgZ
VFAALILWDCAHDPEADVRAVLTIAVLGAQFGALVLLGRWLDRRHALSASRETALALGLTSLVFALLIGGVFAFGAIDDAIGAGDAVSGALATSLLVVALWLAAVRYPQARARALEAATLEREAELLELRGRLQPHFLCNALNTIAGLVGNEPERARDLLGDLGDLLRDLATTREGERTVREEVTWLRRYASLFEARHDGVLRFEWRIEESALDALLPCFVVQPLVENAVVHGRARDGTRTVTVLARRTSAHLVVRVENTTPASSRRDVPGAGVGTALVERRLALYRPGAHLTLRQEGESFVAEVRIPLASGA